MRPGGQPNVQQLMKQAQKMQQQMLAAQEQLAEATVEGTSGGGLVRVTATGSGEITAIFLDPKAVDPADVESLEDLVLAAIRDAARAAAEMSEQTMGPLTQGMGGPLGFSGLPGM